MTIAGYFLLAAAPAAAGEFQRVGRLNRGLNHGKAIMLTLITRVELLLYFVFMQDYLFIVHCHAHPVNVEDLTETRTYPVIIDNFTDLSRVGF